MFEDITIFRTQEAAVKTMGIYGVGSCGPRGFYGTAGKFYRTNVL